jgi:hypothetical protein
MLSESQIATQSLKELFEFSDDYSSFLTETAHPDLSQSITEGSPYPLVNLGEQADGNTAFPGPDTLDQGDPGITSFTDYLFLTSPVDPQDMDW